MATSSITHNFVVSNPNSIKRFVAAIDEADRDRTPKQTLPGRQLTNPQEILALMSKRKKKPCLINILPLIFGHIWIKTNRHISERKVFTTYSRFFLSQKSRCGILFDYIMRLSLPKKDQSITYLVFDAEDASLVGYFSLTVKPISVRASNISKTTAKNAVPCQYFG